MEDGEAVRGLMFCTGGFESRAANVISLVESLLDKLLETGEADEDVPLEGEVPMGGPMACPLTSLSKREPPPPVPVFCPSSTGMTLLLLLSAELPNRACRLGVSPFPSLKDLIRVG